MIAFNEYFFIKLLLYYTHVNVLCQSPRVCLLLLNVFWGGGGVLQIVSLNKPTYLLLNETGDLLS